MSAKVAKVDRQSAPTPPPGRASPRLSRTGTAAFAVLWLLLLGHGWSWTLQRDPVRWLHYPSASAARLCERDIALADAIADDPGWQQPALRWLYGSPEMARDAAIEIHRALLDDSALDSGIAAEEDADLTRARLAVLLVDRGRIDEARDVAEPLGESFVEVIAGSAEDATWEDALIDTEMAGLEGWYASRTLLAAAARLGDLEAAHTIEADQLAQGHGLLQRTVAVVAANLLIVTLGLALGAMRLFAAGGAGGLLQAGLGQAPWTLEDGLGVFIRGDFWSRFYFVALGWVWQIPTLGSAIETSWVGWLLSSWATLFATLPMLWLVYRYLFSPAASADASPRINPARIFGLTFAPRPLISLLGLATIALAVDLVGTYALGWTSWGLGFNSGWTEGWDEMLVWGGASRVAMTAADYIVWTPAAEELAFRGLVYFSLRNRLGPLAAAMASAGFFSILHFYALPGFLMTFWSGFVWAIAFERARSLIPGFAAHAIYNALYVVGFLLLYR